MDDDLIAAHGELAQLMPYLHLPVQSGSDRILEAMNRRHKADDYRRLIDRIRTVRSDLALSGDFIVGFPGETDRDFVDTLRLVADIGYASAYSFKYSARPGTPAAGAAGQVDEAVKAERLAALQQLLDAQRVAFNVTTVGRRLPVLFDRPGRKPGQILGRSPYLQAVHVDGPSDMLGRIADVTVTAALANSLAGTLDVAPNDTVSTDLRVSA